jgi:hypothetical protein
MLIYAIFFIVAIYVIYKERQALGCPNIPNGIDCDNQNGKAVRGTKSNNSDSTQTLWTNLENGTSYLQRYVEWRSFFVLSVLSSILIFFLLYERFPSELELVVSCIVICFLLCSFRCFYEFHLHSIVRSNMQNTINILKSRLSMQF